MIAKLHLCAVRANETYDGLADGQPGRHANTAAVTDGDFHVVNVDLSPDSFEVSISLVQPQDSVARQHTVIAKDYICIGIGAKTVFAIVNIEINAAMKTFYNLEANTIERQSSIILGTVHILIFTKPYGSDLKQVRRRNPQRPKATTLRTSSLAEARTFGYAVTGFERIRFSCKLDLLFHHFFQRSNRAIHRCVKRR
jgi:hypothetical protein